ASAGKAARPLILDQGAISGTLTTMKWSGHGYVPIREPIVLPRPSQNDLRQLAASGIPILSDGTIRLYRENQMLELRISDGLGRAERDLARADLARKEAAARSELRAKGGMIHRTLDRVTSHNGEAGRDEFWAMFDLIRNGAENVRYDRALDEYRWSNGTR